MLAPLSWTVTGPWTEGSTRKLSPYLVATSLSTTCMSVFV